MRNLNLKTSVVRLSVLFLLLAVIAQTSFAQRARFLSTENGLSSSRINHVLQDADGDVWIATEYGLDRYDGVRVRHYNERRNDSTSLSSNFVFKVHQSPSGQLYMLTMKGICRFDKETDTFTRIPFYNESGNYMPISLAESIVESPHHGTLVATSGWGLFKMNPDGDRADPCFGDLKSRFANYLMTDRRQRLWISTIDKGVFCILPNKKVNHVELVGLKDKPVVTCLAEGKDGVVYAGTDGCGVLRYDEQSQCFLPLAGMGRRLIVRSMMGEDDRMLVGTDGNGLFQIKTGAAELTPVTDLWLPMQMDKCTANHIMYDHKGNLWVSFYKMGIGVFPKEKSPFEYFGPMQFDRNVIGNSPVTAVESDNSGRIWVAVENDALYFIDHGDLAAQGGPKGHGKMEASGGHALNNLKCLHLAGNGQLWLGTQGDGLLRMNTTTGQVVQAGVKADGTPWIPNNYISAIQDDSYGNMWIGTYGDGLFFMDMETGVVVPCNAVGDAGLAEGSNAISNRWITSLALGYDEQLWIGTFYGLNCMNIKERRMSEYEPLRKEVVTALTHAGTNDICAGTFHGAMMIQPDGMTMLDKESGMPNNAIQSLVSDHEGNIWLGTNNGLVLIRSDNSKPLVFRGINGMGINEFCNGAATVCNNGNVVFGGLTGISIISPDKLAGVSEKPRLYVSAVIHNNEYINHTSASGRYTILETEGNYRDDATLHFAHDDGTFGICLTNYEFANADAVTYMYCINGAEWRSMPDGESIVMLNNLHPGTYKVRLKCSTKNLESDEKVITAVVHRAWYARWYAQLLYLLLMAALVIFMVRSYRNHLLAQEKERYNKRQLSVSESKLKFLINLSHEIRTPMSMIISPVEKLIETDGNNQVRRHYYDIINNGSRRIMQLVNQMLDLSKIEQGKLVLTFRPTHITRYVDNVCSFMDSMAEQKGLVLTFNSLLEDHELWVDNDYFDKILVNLIGNAIKFTPEGGHVSVSITDCKMDGKSAVCIAVTDNGIGISDEDKKHVFERFYQAKQLAKEGGMGTGIGLNLTLSLVEMHQGRIEVLDNAEGQGTAFLIKLWRGNEHIPPMQIGPAVEPEQGEEQRAADGLADMPQPAGLHEPKVNKPSTGPSTVLVIDDDDAIRNYLSAELKSSYKVFTANDGGEGWRMILKQKPDLVITDVMMPVMDGIELCRKIRQNINVNTMPVIMLTAANSEECQLRGLDMGADAYVSKPFSLPVLLSTMKNVLQTRQMLRNCYEGRQESEVDIAELEDVPNHDEVVLGRIIKVIEDNIGNRDLNVEMLAREAALSRVHLYRKLKELTNQSPSDFIRQIRLKKSGELLRKGNYNISEVASLMGFSSLAVFSRAFKDFYGVSPKEYMK